MTIRNKILVGFFSIFSIGLILGVCGLISTRNLTNLSNEQYSLQNASSGVSNVLNAHYIWRQGLTEAVLAQQEFTGSRDPDTCALGKWKNSKEAQGITDPEIISLLKQVDDPHAYIHNEAKSILVMMEAGDLNGAKRDLMENVLPKTGEVISILTAMQERYGILMDEEGIKTINTGNIATTIIIIVVAVSAIISVILALYISGLISQPLGIIVGFLKNASSTGDLTLRPEDMKNIEGMSKRKDEIGSLSSSLVDLVSRLHDVSGALETVAGGDLTAELALLSDKDSMGLSLQKMNDSLNNMFREINASSAQVATGSKQIADGAQSLAQGSTEQAAAVEQLSSSIAEIAGKTKATAGMAGQAANLANTIKINAEKGSRQMGQMTVAVKEINEASQSINKVIKVIDDIAFQTNILALNAAVEAARAGQHGKGFSVVAEEVRNLAAKSAEAAKDTGGLIANSIEKAELGARIADETAASLVEIVSGINKSNQIVSDIAKSSEEQSEGISQINRGIDQVAQVVQQNSATAEESAATSEEMSGQSDMLEQLIAQFKLKDNDRGYMSLSASSKSARHQPTIPEKVTYGGDDYGKY